MRSVSPFGELTTSNGATRDPCREPRRAWQVALPLRPGIGKNFHAVPPADVDLRRYWDNVHGPVLVIRGENSDLLLAETLEEMRRHPHTEALVIPRTGHAPMLMDAAQVGAVRRFLLG
jgi:pimeloyl-ACP methyl ester carboxylesterase